MADEDKSDRTGSAWGDFGRVATSLIAAMGVVGALVIAATKHDTLPIEDLFAAIAALFPITFVGLKSAGMALRRIDAFRSRRRAWRRTCDEWRELGAKLFAASPQRPMFEILGDDLALAGVRSGAFVGTKVAKQSEACSVVLVTIVADGGHPWQTATLGGWPQALDRQSQPLAPFGDDAFDNLVQVTGPAGKALAIMDGDTRAAVVRAAASRKISIDFASDSPTVFISQQHKRSNKQPFAKATDALAHTIRGCADLVGKLRIAPDQIPEKLAHNATRDRYPWVRCRNLHALVHNYRESEIVPEAVAAALGDPSRAVRAFATTFAGGETAFAQLSRFVTDEAAPDDLRAEALNYLVLRFSPARVRALIIGGLSSACAAVKKVACKAAAESGDPELVAAVCALAKGAVCEDRELIMRWLVDSDAPCVEPALLDLIACRRPDAALPALEAVGAIGTERSVGVLLDLLSDAALQGAARRALQRIQARTKALDDGRLSLAAPEPQAGAVSLAGEQGALALAPTRDGKS
jgi:hypothetical protein